MLILSTYAKLVFEASSLTALSNISGHPADNLVPRTFPFFVGAVWERGCPAEILYYLCKLLA